MAGNRCNRFFFMHMHVRNLWLWPTNTDVCSVLSAEMVTKLVVFCIDMIPAASHDEASKHLKDVGSCTAVSKIPPQFL